jgi:iron(II)-dependent oxidoreductase
MAFTGISNGQLIEALRETRARTLELVNDLSDEQLIGPRLQIVNPLLWEIAHLAWFQEFWVLRHLAGQPPILTNGDELYDSARVAHDTRWDLPLPGREKTLAYMQRVLERAIDQAGEDAGLADSEGFNQDYFLNLVLLHEQMHDEAITYTRQTLSYPAPAIAVNRVSSAKQMRFFVKPTMTRQLMLKFRVVSSFSVVISDQDSLSITSG